MIAQLKGTLASKSPVEIVVDVNGVGYRVFIPLSTYYGLPEVAGALVLRIHTHMAENTLRLFGFLTGDELRVFETLIGITKVGPKLALAILSGISVPELAEAVRGNDIARLSAIPGVGRKTAERLALEIKDKLEGLGAGTAASTQVPPADGAFADALSALVNLGYKKAAAENALQRVRRKTEDKLSLEGWIKECLKYLS